VIHKNFKIIARIFLENEMNHEIFFFVQFYILKGWYNVLVKVKQISDVPSLCM